MSFAPGEPATSGEDPAAWIVILNWNGLSDTLECLESISRLRYANTHVVVVDNGSTEAEADTIASRFPEASLLRNGTNLGYAGGNNVGIRHALRQGARYVWLLNNDTVVHEECLTALITAGEQDARVGLLSPVIYDHAPPRDIQFAGAIIDYTAEAHHTLRSIEASRASAERAPLLLWGTALLLKRQAIETTGLLDERYFAYHEDIDYCLRALARHVRTLVVPEAAVFHKDGRSLGSPASPTKEYLLVRNWYFLWRTYLRGWRRHTYPGRYLAWVLNRALNAHRAGNQALAEHTLDGAWDALRGRSGSWQTKGKMPKRLRGFILNGLLAWHPHFWIMLLSGDLPGMLRRALRRGGPPGGACPRR
jgi:GT2 family glycosyltransferase